GRGADLVPRSPDASGRCRPGPVASGGMPPGRLPPGVPPGRLPPGVHGLRMPPGHRASGSRAAQPDASGRAAGLVHLPGRARRADASGRAAELPDASRAWCGRPDASGADASGACRRAVYSGRAAEPGLPPGVPRAHLPPGVPPDEGVAVMERSDGTPPRDVVFLERKPMGPADGEDAEGQETHQIRLADRGNKRSIRETQRNNEWGEDGENPKGLYVCKMAQKSFQWEKHVVVSSSPQARTLKWNAKTGELMAAGLDGVITVYHDPFQ
ncbi:hypothetical protein CYMTET_52356, partial [Cymbomonas tetramitiformis]